MEISSPALKNPANGVTSGRRDALFDAHCRRVIAAASLRTTAPARPRETLRWITDSMGEAMF